VFAAVSIGFLLLPIFLVVLFAFSNKPLTNFPIEQYSFVWWQRMVAGPDFYAALKRSLEISSCVAILGTAIGTMTAFGLHRLSDKLARTLLIVGMTPVAMPPLILAVALLVSFVRSGLGLGVHAVIIAHLIVTSPIVAMIVYGRLRMMDPTLIQCARDLGASPRQALMSITIPLIAPTIIGACFVIFAISIDEFILTSFTLGGGSTLPTLVWGMMRTGATPVVNAIGTIMIALSMGMIFLAIIIAQRKRIT